MELGEKFFTSDLHLGHARMTEFRPFATVEEMNETLISNWNELVQPHDQVFVLGDVALGKIAETLPLVKRLNGMKFLVPGNHDRCWEGHSKVRTRDREMYEEVGFVILPGRYRLPHYSGLPWVLSHFPSTPDERHGQRYVEHLPALRPDEEWLIHGHVHDAWKINGNQINVGVDVWDWRPAHISQLRTLMAERDSQA